MAEQEDDVEKLAEQEAFNLYHKLENASWFIPLKVGIKEGYNKAREKYKYTNEDMLVIRNQLVTMLPVGAVTSWDIIQAISKYTRWLDDYVESISQRNIWKRIT